jgi:hypothetical protein
VLIDSAEQEQADPMGGATFNAAIARSYGESPEIDPVIFIPPPGGEACEEERPGVMPEGVKELSFETPAPPPPAVGERRTVEIIGSRGYDLIATIAGSGDHERKDAGR